ncbi:metal ABC transporter permease [candidate division KSB1 bacterium]
MTTALLIMFAPFVACLTLVGIHGYFGIHVLKREIIFIDIAMAQIAALGGTISMILPVEVSTAWGTVSYATHGGGIIAYLFSLVLVFFAAAVFTLLKSEKLYVSIEALIGITFAAVTTGAVILIDKGAGGDTHVKEMLVGSILWVKWSDILKSFIVYSVIGALHYQFRDKILPISENYQKAKEKGINVKLWDFFFYFTLGIVVIHSVKIGGILVVFAFLIIPASISVLFSQNWSTRIAIGWIVGTLVTTLGLYFSWTMDVPSGPSVILFLGVALLVALIIRKLNLFGVADGKGAIPETAGDISKRVTGSSDE